jgi:hypothetical protein
VQNFLFTTKDEHAQLKAIDFGLSDFIKPGGYQPLITIYPVLRLSCDEFSVTLLSVASVIGVGWNILMV